MKKCWKYVKGCKRKFLDLITDIYTHITVVLLYLVIFYLLDSFGALSKLLYNWFGIIFVSNFIFSCACVVLMIFECLFLWGQIRKILSTSISRAVTQYLSIMSLFLLLLCATLFIYMKVSPYWFPYVLVLLGVLFLRETLLFLEWCQGTREKSEEPEKPAQIAQPVQPARPAQTALRKIEFFDLKKDIYDNVKITRENKSAPILLLDKDVNYDLLHRNHIIASLEEVIRNYIPQSSFVIGLEGEWGSGKSTIIKNVVKDLKDNNGQDYIIIDSFNPWLYNDSETLLRGVFDAILKDTEINYRGWQRRKYMALIDEILSKNSLTYYVSAFLNEPQSLNAKLGDVNGRINEYLKRNDKVIIFFIDEIDRVLPENILLLFKILNVILNLDKIIYVLAYDPERLSKILCKSLNLEPKFLEKIVQMRIKIDVPSSTAKSLYETCLGKILVGYDVPEKSLNDADYKATTLYICSSISSIRLFKRFINSALSTAMLYGQGLYKPDLLALEYMKYADNVLYQELYNNRYFLVSADLPVINKLVSTMIGIDDTKEFLNKKNEFLQKIQTDEKFKPHIKILKNMFPSIHCSTQENLDEYSDNISKNARIASYNCVDVYFTYAIDDEHIKINGDVSQFIEDLINKNIINKDINKGINNNNVDKASDACKKELENPKYNDPDKQTIWFKNFCLFVNYIAIDKPLFVAEMLLKSLSLLRKEDDGISFSPQKKAALYIADLLMKAEKISSEEFNVFMKRAVQPDLKLPFELMVSHLEEDPFKSWEFSRIIKCYHDICKSTVNEKTAEAQGEEKVQGTGQNNNPC